MMQLSMRLLNVIFNYKTYTIYANYTCSSLQLFMQIIHVVPYNFLNC